MGAVWMRLHAEARGRWRAMLGLGLLLGMMAGGATAAAVGARRTETAYPRFRERYSAYDLSLTMAGHPRGEEAFAVAASLPQVAASNRSSLYPVSVRAPSGKQAAFPDVFLLADHGDVSEGFGVKIVEGAAFDPDAVDEAIVNYAMADRLAIEPGHTVSFTLTGAEESGSLPPQDVDIKIVGTYASVGQFESATGGGFPTTIATTPAFHRRWSRYHFRGEDNLGIKLRRGETDIGPYSGALRDELERRGMGDALDSVSGSTEEIAGVQSLNRVPAVALWLLCGFLGITTIAVASQLVAREMRLGADDNAGLRALGFTRGQLVVVSMVRSSIVIGIGVALSVLAAFLLSPFTPVGLARIAEPDPGFALSPLVVGLGALATLVLMSAAAFVSAWSTARRTTRRDTQAGQTAFLLERLARSPLGVSIQSGLRMTVTGRGERAIPVRTAILGTTLAIGALATALTFAGSLSFLIAEPRLAGYTWDAGAIPAAFDAPSHAALMQKIERAAGDRFPSATLWRGTAFWAATVERIAVAGWASDGPPPSIIDGRAPREADEVAVDPRTLRRLGKKIGDRVNVAPLEEGASPRAAAMRVVGSFAVPRIAFQGENPGQGVALTPAGLERVSPDSEYDEAVYIDFPPGTNFERDLEAFRNAAGADAFAIVSRQQSATVGNVERLSSLPIVLAATTGLLGVATLAHALSTTIRRRRRDLAILKTLGFVGRQVRATVAWQSTSLVVMSLLVGLPLGIAAGRWGWRLFAGQLQVVPVPVVSYAVVAAVAAGAIAVANVIAAFPARIAARTEPAVVLRTE